MMLDAFYQTREERIALVHRTALDLIRATPDTWNEDAIDQALEDLGVDEHSWEDLKSAVAFRMGGL